ncbi:hypothetical protein F511_34765 [Dorcoceras hygrometricum]|uniref:Transposase (Putative), gypsy type n=1 Tax=Dorcoceras hygrometricum TaxID=472368 RepID=A0A2Z7AZX0_9LAMI|nr:hypothetical protein F511_34765 [Dorcoceras hygrometricum]
MGKFEVVIPHPDERTHRPPSGFHTFYMNQIEMGLRFPIPRFIAAFCRHIQLSPSQLAPNSYSFLLALAVLLSYRDIPLIPYVLMQLVQVKRLGPGKFYLSHKGDHSFIKGNPRSHKGWMSRFFYIKCDVMRDPWRCEMHWRDSVITIVPRTPDRAPSLTPFLEAMCDKSYNAPELIKEDLLCLFKFRRKGAKLVGDLDDRMGKAELVKAMQEAVVASPKNTTKKRKAPSAAEKEARGEKRKKAGASTSGVRTEEASNQKRAPTPLTSLSEEALDVPPVTATTGAPSSGKEPEQPPPFDPSKDSLVESSCPVAATRYICNMAPDRDVRVLRKARNADVVGHFSSNLATEGSTRRFDLHIVYRPDRNQQLRELLDSTSPRLSLTCFTPISAAELGDKDARIPLPWELLQPILRILGHCLLGPLGVDEVKDAASVAVRRLYARASHELVPQAILATRSLIQLDKRAREAAKAATGSAAVSNSTSSNANTPSNAKKPEILLVSK